METETEIHLPGRSQEPILDIKIGNTVYACLVDTGTTYSTLTNLPESSKVTGKVNVVVIEGKQASVSKIGPFVPLHLSLNLLLLLLLLLEYNISRFVRVGLIGLSA